MAARAEPLRSPGLSLPVRVGRFVANNLVLAYAALALVYLFLPIFVMVLFSFNDLEGRFNFVWQGFTLEHWRHPFRDPALGDAMLLSLRVAAISTVIATALGTLVAVAMVRYRFFGVGPTNFLILLPLATPEIVLGASLLSLFLELNIQTGFTTILIAHVMFNISYVVVTVRARLRGFDWTLEEAAMDLGANEIQTFRKVTLPLIFPGILAGALLAFALSLDDFIITLFNAGQEVTFPLYVWGVARVAAPPQVNVMGTMILAVTAGLIVLSLLVQRRRS